VQPIRMQRPSAASRTAAAVVIVRVERAARPLKPEY
jgi:hypothetical protein